MSEEEGKHGNPLAIQKVKDDRHESTASGYLGLQLLGQPRWG